MNDDYQMDHRPPGPEDGAPLHDLTGNGVYPSDVYTHPQYYNMGEDAYWDAFDKARVGRGKPEGHVQIFRALPCPAPRKRMTLHKGDWVTTVKSYARQHGKHDNDPSKDMCVGSARVKRKCIHTAGDSMLEWGYNCEDRPMWSEFRPRKRKE